MEIRIRDDELELLDNDIIDETHMVVDLDDDDELDELDDEEVMMLAETDELVEVVILAEKLNDILDDEVELDELEDDEVELDDTHIIIDDDEPDE